MIASLSLFLPALGGGVLIGLAAGGLRLATGRTAGISVIFGRAITGPDRGWRLAFLAGLLAAGLAARAIAGPGIVAGIERSSMPVLAAAGLLVGLGAGLSNGCTSGHGVCGLARLSRRSLIAVATFMLTAAITVFVLHHAVSA